MMRTPRLLHSTLTLGFSLVLIAATCDGKPDTAELLSEGEVTTDTGAMRALNHPISSDSYKKWLLAQSALDSVYVDPKLRLNPRRLTAPEIDRVVASLEEQPTPRAAIEGSGLSVRDYVLTTIALSQSWDAVNRPGTRFNGLAPENVEWMRRQAADDSGIRGRPRARILDDDSDSEDSDDSDRKKKRKNRNGKDSDSDS